MNSRWCIIAGARSGSTWLEELIYNSYFLLGSGGAKLGEPLEFFENRDSSIDHKYHVTIFNQGLLGLDKFSIKSSVDKHGYLIYLIDTFKSAKIDQDVVLKIFPQDWKYSEEDYTNFLLVLKSLNFKFINLNRNLIDRAISWHFMKDKKIVHRWKENNKEYFSTKTGIADINEVSNTAIDLSVKDFLNYIDLTKNEDRLKLRLLKNIEYVNVNYETLIEDCKKHDIPIGDTTRVQKTHSKPYKELISNYDELLSQLNQQPIKFNDMSKTICRFAWDYPVLSISRNELRFCCRTAPNKISDEEFKRGSNLFTGFIPMIEVRKELLKGNRHPNCSSCWQIEDSGGTPLRTNFDDFVRWVHKHNVWPELTISDVRNRLLNITEDQIEDLIKIDETRMIEISLGNTCDLKCVYCNHHYSSQWATEKLKYKEITADTIEVELPKVDTFYEDIFWKWFEENSAVNVSTINFIGGEPLIIDKFYSYLDRITKFYETTPSNNEHVEIAVVTNFNTPPKLYNKFLTQALEIALSDKLKLDLNVSCESINQRAEFIRTGTKWELLDGNIKNFLSQINILNLDKSKIIFNFQIALNSLCISDLPNFFKYIVELENTYNIKIHLRQNQVVYPEWLNPAILPADYASYIDSSISILNDQIKNQDVESYTSFGRWDAYIEFLKSVRNTIINTDKNIQAQKDFVFNVDQLSERRKLNFYETFPEMIEFYKNCKILKKVNT